MNINIKQNSRDNSSFEQRTTRLQDNNTLYRNRTL